MVFIFNSDSFSKSVFLCCSQSFCFTLFQLSWFILFITHCLPLGACQTTVNMEDTVSNPGLPSTATAVTPDTQAPPVTTVSTHTVCPQWMGTPVTTVSTHTVCPQWMGIPVTIVSTHAVCPQWMGTAQGVQCGDPNSQCGVSTVYHFNINYLIGYYISNTKSCRENSRI